MIKNHCISPTTNSFDLCRKLNLQVNGGYIVLIFLSQVSTNITWHCLVEHNTEPHTLEQPNITRNHETIGGQKDYERWRM
jgi:hypothetical protein